MAQRQLPHWQQKNNVVFYNSSSFNEYKKSTIRPSLAKGLHHVPSYRTSPRNIFWVGFLGTMRDGSIYDIFVYDMYTFHMKYMFSYVMYQNNCIPIIPRPWLHPC